jgi:hypothetical protein
VGKQVQPITQFMAQGFAYTYYTNGNADNLTAAHNATNSGVAMLAALNETGVDLTATDGQLLPNLDSKMYDQLMTHSAQVICGFRAVSLSLHFQHRPTRCSVTEWPVTRVCAADTSMFMRHCTDALWACRRCKGGM